VTSRCDVFITDKLKWAECCRFSIQLDGDGILQRLIALDLFSRHIQNKICYQFFSYKIVLENICKCFK